MKMEPSGAGTAAVSRHSFGALKPAWGGAVIFCTTVPSVFILAGAATRGPRQDHDAGRVPESAAQGDKGEGAGRGPRGICELAPEQVEHPVVWAARGTGLFRVRQREEDRREFLRGPGILRPRHGQALLA